MHSKWEFLHSNELDKTVSQIVSLWTISFSYSFSLLIHLFNFGQLWSGKRASTNNNNRSIKHIWTVDSVNAIVSWPVEHFCCTRKFTVRELEINERTISTSQGLAKVVCPLVLNSIMCVYLDGRLRGALQLTLKSSDTLSYRWSYYLELVVEEKDTWQTCRRRHYNQCYWGSSFDVVKKHHCLRLRLLFTCCSSFHILAMAFSANGFVKDPALLSSTITCFSLGRANQESVLA